MSDQSFRVWRLRNGSDFTPVSGSPAFCVDAGSHEAAASQIALELSMGGYYRVQMVASAGSAKIVRIVPVTTYEAVECVADAHRLKAEVRKEDLDG